MLKSFLLFLLIIYSHFSNAVWTSDSNYIKNSYGDEKSSSFSLAAPNALYWEVFNVRFFEFNTKGGYDVGYLYELTYDIGEGVDVDDDGYSNPQLITRADLYAKAAAWFRVEDPGFYMNFLKEERLEFGLIEYFSGVDINIDEELSSEAEVYIPFKADVGNLGAVNAFKSGIYDGDYSKTTMFNLAKIPALKNVSGKVGIARGITGDIGYGFNSITYKQGNIDLGTQKHINIGVDLSSKAGTTVDLTSRDYTFSIEPSITAGVALAAEVNLLGWSLAAYYPEEDSKAPALFEASLPLELLLDPINIQKEVSYYVPTAASATPISTKYLVSVSGAGVIVSKPAGISCSNGNGTCEYQFPEGEIVTLTVGDPNGYQIADWEGACRTTVSASVSRTCSLTVDSDKSVSTKFKNISPPQVSAPSDIEVTASQATSKVPVELGVAVALDDEDGILEATPSITGPFPVGEHTIRWSAVDSSGNTGNATQFVKVNAPEISMLFYSETIPDGTEFSGGELFNKSWTVINTGSVTWDSSYCLKHYNGISLGSTTESCVVGSVLPGGSYTFSAEMVAPAASQNEGIYRDNWRLYYNGQPYSGSIWVEIVVLGIKPAEWITYSAIDKSTIALAWSPSDSAQYTSVLRSSSAFGSFSVVFEGLGSSYTDTGLTADTSYYYKLVSCTDSGKSNCVETESAVDARTFQEEGSEENLISEFSLEPASVEVAKSISINANLTNTIKADNGKFGFSFIWSSDSTLSADDTALYGIKFDDAFVVSPDNSQSFSYSYTIPADMEPGNYNILACTQYKKSSTLNTYCESMPIQVIDTPISVPSKPLPLKFSYEQGETKARISWSSVPNSQVYILERKLSDSSSFIRIYEGGSSYFEDTGLITGESYDYRVFACLDDASVSCSEASEVGTLNILEYAENDFYLEWFRLEQGGSSNNSVNLSTRQLYSGTSTTLLDVYVGFYVSNDDVCNESDDFITELRSGLNVNDVADTEDVIIEVPSYARTGTWYICAIADHDNRYTETDESNNSITITLATSIASPTVTPMDSYLSIEWDEIQDLPFHLIEISRSDNPTDSSLVFADFGANTGYKFLWKRGDACTSYDIRFEACPNDNGDAVCYEAPVVSQATYPEKSPEPKVTRLSENKVSIEFSDSDCIANGYNILRFKTSDSKRNYEYIYDGKEKVIQHSFESGINPLYQVQVCHDKNSFISNDCPDFSDRVIAQNYVEAEDSNWQYLSDFYQFSDRSGYAISEYKNRLYLVGGHDGSSSFNDVWTSENGVDWSLLVENGPFSARKSASLVFHNNYLYLIGGYDVNDRTSRYKDIWRTQDGKEWELVNSNIGWGERYRSTIVSFNGKLFAFSGANRSGSPEYFDDIWYSDDGTSWNVINNSPLPVGIDFSAAVYDNRLWVVASNNRSEVQDNSASYRKLFYSDDGFTWSSEDLNYEVGLNLKSSLVNYSEGLIRIGGQKLSPYYGDSDLIYSEYEIYVDDVWGYHVSDGWNELSSTSSIPNEMYFSLAEFTRVLTFNGYIYLFNGGSDAGVWRANFGYEPNDNKTTLTIPSNLYVGQLVSATLSIDDAHDITYQWFVDGAAVLESVDEKFLLEGLNVGSVIQLRVRFKDSNNDIFTVFSNEVSILPNPVEVFFDQEFIDLYYSTEEYSIPINGADADLSLTVDVSDPDASLVTINSDNTSIILKVLEVGISTITVTATDSDGNSDSTSIQVNVKKAESDISFSVSAIDLDKLGSSSTLSLSGTGSGAVSYSTDTPNIVELNNLGNSVEVTPIDVGTTIVRANRLEDEFYLGASASFSVTVNNNDFDNDTLADDVDSCPFVANQNQLDSDGDFVGDACDDDDDNDGVIDSIDAFPLDPSETSDTDNDGIGDNSDEFPTSAEESVDSDSDGYGNNQDSDDDNDGLPDVFERFHGLDPEDSSDALLDSDGDGYSNIIEYCFSTDILVSDSVPLFNPDMVDTDLDGVPDIFDWAPNNINEFIDTDFDGVGNNEDQNDDGDALSDQFDEMPLNADETLDSDGDGFGNNEDAFPFYPYEHLDTDSDGIGNNIDTDDDGDSVLDAEDAFPLDSTETSDVDGDGIGDNSDAFPNDGSEWVDTDNDGIGDNSDIDTDNDGINDDLDEFPLDPDEWQDSDGDGIGDNKDAGGNQTSDEDADNSIDNIGSTEEAPAATSVSSGGSGGGSITLISLLFLLLFLVSYRRKTYELIN